MIKQWVLKQLLAVSVGLRKKRIRRLTEHVEISESTRILDVGGSGDWDWASYSIHAEITVINLNPPPANCAVKYVQGSACDMHMFLDQEFDLVFSNSVIEHLLSTADQEKMAQEILRVGKAYWVQTPNRHFPIELHLCFPFFQYLPLNARLFIARHWPLSFQKLRGKSAEADAQAILLTKTQLTNLFPGARLVCEKFMGITKSLIVMRGFDA